jgi:hypothetical protein
MPKPVVEMLPNGNANVLAPVGKMLADLGILGIGHYVMEIESHGNLVVLEEKKIILARN